MGMRVKIFANADLVAVERQLKEFLSQGILIEQVTQCYANHLWVFTIFYRLEHPEQETVNESSQEFMTTKAEGLFTDYPHI